MLRSRNAAQEVIERLRVEDFADADTREIYSALLTLALSNKPIDPVTLDEELTRRGKLDEVGGPAFLVDLVRCVPTAANVKAYIDIVYECARLRGILAIAEAIKRGVQRDKSDTLLAKIEGAVWDIANRSSDSGDGWVTLSEAAIDAYTACEKPSSAIPTGIRGLDDILCGGFRGGALYIPGARPGKGKSAFMLIAALNAARVGKEVCFISLEMHADENGQRALANASTVMLNKMRIGGNALNESDWELMARGLEQIQRDGGDKFRFRRSPHQPLEKIEMLARQEKRNGRLDILFIDYIQLVGVAEKVTSEYDRLTLVSRRLKLLALELDIPIIAAAQIRRPGADESKTAQRAPTIAELKGSGSLEQDADTVILLHIAENDEDKSLKAITPVSPHYGIFARAMEKFALPFSIEVAKQRQGATGRVWGMLSGKTMTYIEDE